MHIRRINLFGGPASFKSTIAAFLFSELKSRGFSIEYVYEYIKFWTYIPRKPKSFDSLYCMAKQLHAEDTILRGETKLIVSDSPLFLQCFYAKYHKDKGADGMRQLAIETENIYPSMNIFLNRNEAYYSEIGRFENLEQAKDIDKALREYLTGQVVYKDFDCDNKKDILNYVIKKIG